MPFLQIRKEIGEVIELIPEERISECTVEEINDVPVPHRRTQGVRWKESGIHNEGRVHLGDEDEENKLEEMKVVIVVER